MLTTFVDPFSSRVILDSNIASGSAKAHPFITTLLKIESRNWSSRGEHRIQFTPFDSPAILIRQAIDSFTTLVTLSQANSTILSTYNCFLVINCLPSTVPDSPKKKKKN